MLFESEPHDQDHTDHSCAPWPHFSGCAPIFPLPGVVLVTGGEQILHIFELRYQAMLAHALEGEKLIGMAVFDAARPTGQNGVPPVCDVVGLGRILEHQPLPEGRALILLKGVGRYRILREEHELPFRVAHLEPLPTTCDDLPLAAEEARRLYGRLGGTEIFPCEGDVMLAADALSNRLLAQLPLETAVRQQVFSLPDLNRRLAALHRLLDGLEQRQAPSQN